MTKSLVRGPSCHQNKVLLFGEFIKESVAYPLPHRQYVFSLPKMLRIDFRNNRELLRRLCQIAKSAHLLAYLIQWYLARTAILTCSTGYLEQKGTCGVVDWLVKGHLGRRAVCVGCDEA